MFEACWNWNGIETKPAESISNTSTMKQLYWCGISNWNEKYSAISYCVVLWNCCAVAADQKKGSVAVAFCLCAVFDVFLCGSFAPSTLAGGGEMLNVIVAFRCFFILFVRLSPSSSFLLFEQWTFSVKAFDSFSMLEFKFLLDKFNTPK